MENQKITKKPEEECESCPICLEEYGKKNDGTFLLKDGLCNSDCKKASKYCEGGFECKHFLCVKCCEQLFTKWYKEHYNPWNKVGKIPCPMCRVDWFYFLSSRCFSGAYDDYIQNPSPTEIETNIVDLTDYESEEVYNINDE
jgi:hypothetical protein